MIEIRDTVDRPRNILSQQQSNSYLHINTTAQTCTHLPATYSKAFVWMLSRKGDPENDENGEMKEEDDVFLEILFNDYGNIIQNDQPFTSNLEYMQMIEYIFLLKK